MRWLFWSCCFGIGYINTSYRHVCAASLIDTTSFLATDPADITQPLHPLPRDRSRALLDEDSFLSSPVMVMKMDRDVSSLPIPPLVAAPSYTKEEQDLIFTKAMTHLSHNLYPPAILLLTDLIAHFPLDSNLHFNLGAAFQQAGDISRALDSFRVSFQLEPRETRALLNFGVLVQSMGDFELAASTYRQILKTLAPPTTNTDIDMHCKVSSNLGASYFQGSRTTEAKEVFEELSELLQHLMAMNCMRSQLERSGSELLRETCEEMQSSYDQSVNYLAIIAHSLADFKDREVSLAYLLRRTLSTASIIVGAKGTETDKDHRSKGTEATGDESLMTVARVGGQAGPMLPFDSLLNEVSLQHRLVIAEAASAQLLASLPPSPPTSRHPLKGQQRPLKIGFITCDFNNHPTAHLVEGIFAVVRKQRERKEAGVKGEEGVFGIELVAFSYGVADTSIFRQNIMALADSFIDLADLSDEAASAVIQEQKVDILLDMQLHTLGHRLQITATQPSPVQINYLVYPGTSGAPFLQYLVADPAVTPAEHAPHHSEALLLLPSTYQMSFYDRYEDRELTPPLSIPPSTDRVPHAQPARPVKVLCNFNKIDKFDSDSLVVWTQVMNRFPASVFRLVLDTREEVVENILSEFALRGVRPSRVKFLPRVSKEEHIRRHGEMDLFLDSLVYGAHSTATDALRGGLPLLTVEGAGFPQRVGSSLLSSLGKGGDKKRHGDYGADADDSFSELHSLLLTYSKKSFEDMAVRLLRAPEVLRRLRCLLLEAGESSCERQQSPGACTRPSSSSTPPTGGKAGFFNTEALVVDFLHGMQAAAEVDRFTDSSSAPQTEGGSRGGRNGNGKLPHIVVTRR